MSELQQQTLEDELKLHLARQLKLSDLLHQGIYNIDSRKLLLSSIQEIGAIDPNTQEPNLPKAANHLLNQGAEPSPDLLAAATDFSLPQYHCLSHINVPTIQARIRAAMVEGGIDQNKQLNLSVFDAYNIIVQEDRSSNSQPWYQR